jgi:hypothetical protein
MSASADRSAERPIMTQSRHRIFLLSPANTGGIRAKMLFNPNATFELAVQLRTPRGAPVGDVFSFLSGLYFRGKLAYAQAHARPARGVNGVHVITSSRGLIPPDTLITIADLHEFASVPIDLSEPRYRKPLAEHARAIATRAPDADVVLLGSVATGKYVDIFLDIFGERLRFPASFVGRGDMSRGGLMLRHLDAERELEYIPVAGAVRHGARPPKLEKLR